MKKLLILFCLLMILVSCSKTNSVENPMEKHESLEEINEISHGNIPHPAVAGVSDEEYYIIKSGEDVIAQYTFKVAGIKYTIRFSDTILKEDISGIYLNGSPAYEDMNTDLKKGEGLYLSRWFTVDGQYVMTAEDTIDEDTFKNIVEEINALSANR